MAINAAQAYKNNQVQTATPAKLTLMLYDGIIRFCNLAIAAIDEKDYMKANTNIIKAEKIVTHLRSTLNFKYPVATEFDNVYDYVYIRLVEANIKKDIEIIKEVIEHIKEIRSAWAEIMKQA
ncbi:MAG TPA: flagellar export chaperone FliS [Clostridiales bacterium]|nr:flagellar export chaperone FliS [Clostridiales bacterium]